MKYKYCLIVSQYYHSRHMFIVQINENFIENAKKFASDLMDYKRSDYQKEQWKVYLGDLDPKYSDGDLRSRYNVNDAGDIYFLNAEYVNQLTNAAFEYQEDSRRESVGYKKKAVIESISKHHNSKVIESLVEKFFDIA